MFPNRNNNKKLTKSKPISRKLIILTALIVGAIGTYILFFAKAATNNCQPENGVQICDVDQVAATNDTVLSMNGEAESLGSQGWGTYYGAAFRAPTTAYNGAVPIHRVFNSANTWHDWVTDTQKSEKEAKYGANTYEGVAFFAWTDARQPGTVPVYRLTRGGAETNTIWSTDKAWVDKMIALGGSAPNAWKLDNLMPGIAFYAFPPNYTVAGQVNPFDCSILENFTSDRCQKQRENLVKEIDNGNIPATNECPKNLNDYLKNPLSSGLPVDCQTFWNNYAKDCSITENFNSDRCIAEREAIAKEQQRQIEERRKQEEVARRKRLPRPDEPTKPKDPGVPCPDGYAVQNNKCVKTCDGILPGKPGYIMCKKDKNFNPPNRTPVDTPCGEGYVKQNNQCVKTCDGIPPGAPGYTMCIKDKNVNPTPAPQTCDGIPAGAPGYIQCVKDRNINPPAAVKKDCLITFWQVGYIGGWGSGTRKQNYGNQTKAACDAQLVSNARNRTLNSLNKPKENFKEYWGGNYIRTIK